MESGHWALSSLGLMQSDTLGKTLSFPFAFPHRNEVLLCAMTTIASSLHWIDLSIFGIFFAVIFAAVIFAQNHRQSQPHGSAIDYLALGRKLTLPLFVITLVATWYGGILGVAEIAIHHGIYSFITQGLFWYVAYLILAWVLIPRMNFNTQAITLPDYLGTQFGEKSRNLSAILNLFNLLPIAYCLSLGFLFEALFGWELWQGVIFGTLFTIAYSVIGGFRSVVASDLIQFILMFSAVLILFLVSVLHYGGLSYLEEHLPATHFTVTGQTSWAELMVWFFIAMTTLVDPNFYHRFFATQSAKTAKKGVLIATGFWLSFDFLMVGGALYAKAALPQASTSTDYLHYAFNTLPTGLRGFFLAGIAATIFSTLDSYLFLSSSTVVHDLLKKSKSIQTQKWSLLVIGLISSALALISNLKIETIWITLGSISAGALLVPLLFHFIFKWSYTDQEFFLILLSSALMMVIGYLFSPFKIPEIYYGLGTGLIGVSITAIQKKKKIS